MELIDGMKGCGGCHKIGLKDEAEIRALKEQGQAFGVASCDACHTRHSFSVVEARQPQACQTCHMGFDHPQWEMYSTSKHGIRHGMKRDGIELRPVTLPAMYGDATVNQLPVAIVGADFKLDSGSADVEGRVVTADKYEFAGESIDDVLLERIGPMVERIPLDIAALLDEDEIAAMQRRATKLVTERTLPAESASYRSYPWPLV